MVTTMCVALALALGRAAAADGGGWRGVVEEQEAALPQGAVPVDTADIADLAPDEFEERYLRGSRPLRLTGVAMNWSATRSWGSKEQFAELHGGAKRQARWAGGGNQFGILARSTAVSDYLAEMGTDEAAGREGLLFDSGLGQREEWDVPPLFAEAGLDDSLVSVGPAAQGLPFHNHATAWQTVVLGRKAFLLLPPLAVGEGSWLRPEPYFTEILSTMFFPSSQQFLARHAADVWRLVPQAAKLLRVVVLGPGETLFIPCNWYHATINLADTVAVGGQATDEGGLGRCPSDVYGAASNAYAQSVIALREARRSSDVSERAALLTEAAELGERACAINTFNFACATQMGALLAIGGDVPRAVELYREAAGRYGGWAAEGLLACRQEAQLSAVLASYAEELMLSKEYASQPAAMALATELVQAAVDADGRRDNIKAHMSSVAYSLATAQTRRQQTAALEHAEGVVQALEGGRGGHFCYQPLGRMVDVSVLRDQLAVVVAQARDRFGATAPRARKKGNKKRGKRGNAKVWKGGE